MKWNFVHMRTLLPTYSRLVGSMVLFGLAMVAFFARPAMAQLTTADLLGAVADPSQAVVPSATVTLVDEETQVKRVTAANAEGQYIFNLIPRGAYTVGVDAAGFKHFQVAHIALAAGDRLRLNVTLQLNGTQETVEVNVASAALQTDSSTIGSVIGEKAVQDLPLNGRNFVQLAQLAAGVNEGPSYGVSSGTRPEDRRQSGTISANGQADTFNNELLDGTDNNERVTGTIGVRPSIDSIAEFRVQTSLYTAEVGRTAGAVVSIITKSGSNQFHGTAFEFARNEAFNARNYFSTIGDKPQLHLNQFGGSINGPVQRDKTFFFADYEGFRFLQGITTILTVPTAYEQIHIGDFSDIGGVTLPAASINQIAKNYFALYPKPNLSGTSNNYDSTSLKTQNSDTADARIDHVFNANNLFFARYTLNNVNTDYGSPLPVVNGIAPGGNLTAYDGTSEQYAQNGQLNYTHIFNPRLLLELKTAYSRMNFSSYPLNYGVAASTAMGLPGVNQNKFTSGLAPMYFNGAYANLGDGIGMPAHNLDNVYQLNGAVTLNLGKHSIKAGAALLRRQYTQSTNYRNGLFVFASLDGSSYGAMKYFLLGVPYSVTRVTELYAAGLRSWEPSVYVQDDWRVNRSLTLNLGVRYDVFTPVTEAHNRLSNFDTSTGKLIVAGVSADSHAGVATDYGNFAPRLGFAQSLGSRTVLRGGFGLSFFATNVENGITNAPYVSTYGPVYYGTSSYKGLSAGLPTTLAAQDASNPSGSLYGVDRNLKSGYVSQYNMILQRQTGANVISLGYVGERGHRLGERIPNIDAPAPSTATSAQLAALRPYYSTVPNVTSIFYLTSQGVSSYDSLQVDFQRHLNKGIVATANYTYAHGIDDIQTTSLGTWGAYGLLPKQISTYDRGNSDMDMRHRFATTVSYTLPAINRGNALVRKMLSKWQFNSIFVWNTGLPFSVYNAVPQINTGVTLDRPNRTGSGKLAHPSATKWFDVSSFTAQTKGTAGNSGRNILNTGNQRHLDASLFKTIPLHNQLRLDLRVESFNLTNTPNYGFPNENINSTGAGSISSTTIDARAFQLAAKLAF